MVTSTLQTKLPPVTMLILYVLMVAISNCNAQDVTWDTVSTGKVRLAVSNHGSMGLNGIGGANMDFAALGGDCDPSADIYLYSGGLFVLQEIEAGVDYRLNTGLYQDSVLSPVSFVPDPSGPPPSHFVGPDNSDAFFTGRFVDFDSTIGFQRTYYAPTVPLPYHNVAYIVVKTEMFPMDDLPHGPLAIGEVMDWDIPSFINAYNTAGFTDAILYIQGTDTSGGCQSGITRAGVSQLLGWYTSSGSNAGTCDNETEYYGAYAVSIDSSLKNASHGGMDPNLAWDTTLLFTGVWYSRDTTDQHIVNTILHGFWLQPDDTLSIYTALACVKEDSAFLIQYPLELACEWYALNIRPDCGNICSCCERVGNIDGDPSEGIDLGDLTAFIDFLFISFTPPAACYAVADINYDCVIDIGDLTAMIDCLFISWWCPWYPCPPPFASPCNWPEY